VQEVPEAVLSTGRERCADALARPTYGMALNLALLRLGKNSEAGGKKTTTFVLTPIYIGTHDERTNLDQTDVLYGKSEAGNRDSLLSFIGGNLVAARWKQWRFYFTDVHPGGIGPQRQPGMGSSSAPLAGYPKVFNIEMDPHEDLMNAGLFGWTLGPGLEEVRKYLESVKKYPNPPAPDITQFSSHDG
jgi:hypothetical protein